MNDVIDDKVRQPPVTVRPGTVKRGWLRAVTKPEARMGYLFVLPALLPTILFQVIPMVTALFLSLRDYNALTNQGSFIGLRNYTDLLTNDYLFWTAVSNTVKFATGFVPLDILFGLVAALLVNRRWKGIGLIRSGFYLPYLSAGVVVAFLWLWLFSPGYGLVDVVFHVLRLPEVDWFGSANLAMGVLVLAAAWQNFPGAMVIFLASLQGVPTEIINAAEVDGASRIDVIRYITVPLLRPVTFYLIVVGVIGAMQVFDIVNVITTWVSPDFVTSMVQQIYQNALGSNRMGYGAAEAVLLFLAIVGVTYLNFRIFRRDIQY